MGKLKIEEVKWNKLKMRNDLLEINRFRNFKGGGFLEDVHSEGTYENSTDEEEED